MAVLSRGRRPYLFPDLEGGLVVLEGAVEEVDVGAEPVQGVLQLQPHHNITPSRNEVEHTEQKRSGARAVRGQVIFTTRAAVTERMPPFTRLSSLGLCGTE